MGLGTSLAKAMNDDNPAEPDGDEPASSADPDDDYDIGGEAVLAAVNSGDAAAVGRAIESVCKRCIAQMRK